MPRSWPRWHRRPIPGPRWPPPRADLNAAQQALAEARETLRAGQARKTELQAARDSAQSALAAARADLAGVEREHGALERDRETRAKQAGARKALPVALDRVRAAPGYERALAAVLGRDARAGIGPVPDGDGRVWTGAAPPAAVADSLARYVPTCPPELAAPTGAGPRGASRRRAGARAR